MERYLVVISTVCFLAGVVHTIAVLRSGVYRPARFNFFAVAAGLICQTAFLWLRGKSIGRCPITNSFEVLIFVAWSVALIYLVVGPVYRLSLMGAFTAPLVFALQLVALIAAPDRPHRMAMKANAWLEFHASMSLIAYGAFALACIAGVMYLVQERQLKRRQLTSFFYQLPPLSTLFGAMTRLLWVGFALYTIGLASGFFTGMPLPRVKVICAFGVWLLYAAILQGRHLRSLAPARIAALCVIAFTMALTLLWGITFVSENLAL